MARKKVVKVGRRVQSNGKTSDFVGEVISGPRIYHGPSGEAYDSWMVKKDSDGKTVRCLDKNLTVID